MQVGDNVIINKDLSFSIMGNKPGTLGVVYDVYEDFDDPAQTGVCVIFENGEYSGFSFDEQKTMLSVVGHNKIVAQYKFTNVMQLTRDFQNNKFYLR